EEIRAIGRVIEGMAAGKRPPQLWYEAKVYGDAHRQAMQQNCRRFSTQQVEAAIAHAARADRMGKGPIRRDVQGELLQLCLRSAASAPARVPAKQGRMTAAARAAARDQTGLF